MIMMRCRSCSKEISRGENAWALVGGGYHCETCHNALTGKATLESVISGVGKDSETIVNEQGGKQSKVQYRFDVLDPKAMFAMCKVLKEGYDKYGDDSNWRRIPVNEHLNHLLIHVYAYLAGDTSDEHLSHALCRAMFALGVELQ